MTEQPPDRDPWLGGDAPPPERPRRPERRERRDDDRPRRDGPGRPRRDGDRRRPGPIARQDNSARTRHDPTWHRDVGTPDLPPDAATWRLFIAVELSPAAIEEIGEFINAMPSGPAVNVRWTPRQNVHLTLQFLGDADPQMVGQMQRNIAEAAANTAPMLLRLGETGAFPQIRAPRILWVGLDGDVHRLMQLQGRIEGSMRAMGFEPERRPFTPHVTVGRVARDLDGQQLGDIGFSWRRSRLPKERAQVPVSEVVLFRSRLQPGGPIYEKIFTAKLGG